MPRKKTQRNKTICTPLEVGADYLRRCMCVASPLESLESVLDRTIRGDMLEVCPLVAADKPKIQVHPLGIGDREDPARLVFKAQTGNAIVVTLVDMGDRLR
ncbi:MAG: hypothetical protein SOZ52_08285, partial [Pyramidobacter sp.]|nr:hypothetical protein [Pyramidobacter sp.]